MNCKEFRGIADTYLSDELLVETNHDVHSHLEHCRECRGELASRRDVRSRLRSAIIADEKTKIDPMFANRLRISLKEESREKSFFTIRNLGLSFAGFAVLILSTFAILNFQKSGSDLATWRKLSNEAIVTHKECAIEHNEDWQTSAMIPSSEKSKFRDEILVPLKVKYNEDVDVMDMHECEFHGKTYKHYVLKSGKHTISFLRNETDAPINTKTILEAGKIVSEPRGDFQLASFAGSGNPLFVISDMSEAENVNLARSIRNLPNI